MKIKTLLLSAGILVIAAGLSFAAEIYKIDPVHTNIRFTVKHMVVSRVSGEFKDVEGTISYVPEDVTKSTVEGTIKTLSIYTGQDKRDTHLKSADFFDVEKFPDIKFKSTKIEKTKDGFAAIGDLTIRGVKKQIRLPFKIQGPALVGGKKRMGIEASMKLNRQDYGVAWTNKLQDGSLAVSDEVDIDITAQAVQP